MCGLHVQAGDLRAEQQAAHVAGNAEIDHAGFDDRIDDDHFAALAAQVRERAHQPRMVAGRIAADHEHQVGAFDVVQRNGRRAARRSQLVSPTPLAWWQ